MKHTYDGGKKINTEQEHKDRHLMLHQYLDELIADFISAGHAPFMDRPIKDLMHWSATQIENPTDMRDKDETRTTKDN